MNKSIKLKVEYLIKNGQYNKLKEYHHHRKFTTYMHSIHVAQVALNLVKIFKINVNKDKLITAALLHDYYLYDWHKAPKDVRQRHAACHGHIAAINAVRDYNIGLEEIVAIECHMFPFVPAPIGKIGVLVTIADKICAITEYCGVKYKE